MWYFIYTYIIFYLVRIQNPRIFILLIINLRVLQRLQTSSFVFPDPQTDVPAEPRLLIDILWSCRLSKITNCNFFFCCIHALLPKVCHFLNQPSHFLHLSTNFVASFLFRNCLFVPWYLFLFVFLLITNTVISVRFFIALLFYIWAHFIGWHIPGWHIAQFAASNLYTKVFQVFRKYDIF